MAKTATINVTDDGEPAHDPLEGIDAITAEEANQAFAITDELRGTAGITLQFTRVWPNTPGLVGHCGEMAAEEYTLAECARRYGPGRYVVRLRGPDNRYMKGGGKLNIAGNPQASTPSTAPQGPSDALQMIEAMNRRMDEQQRAADARREKIWALALAAMPVMPAIIAALKGGGGNDLTTALLTVLKPQPQPDVLDMMVKLKALNGGDDKPDTIDQLSKLLNVARDLGGDGGGGSSNWIDLVRDGLKAAPDLLAGMQRGAPQTVQVQAVPVAPQPVQQIPQSAPAQPAAEGQDMWVLIQPILREFAARIEMWAREGKNAQLRAEVLLDDIPQWLADRLKPAEALQFLNHPQWWEHLTAFHPPLAQYRKWIDDMRAELIEIITEQLKDEKPPDSNNGE